MALFAPVFIHRSRLNLLPTVTVRGPPTVKWAKAVHTKGVFVEVGVWVDVIAGVFVKVFVGVFVAVLVAVAVLVRVGV